jgi:hypothetical protein
MKALIFLVILLMGELSHAAEVDDLLSGLLARDQAWTSGRVKWTFNDSLRLKQGVGTRIELKPRFLSFQGEDWAVGGARYRDGGGINDWGHPVNASYDGWSAVWPKTFPHPTSIQSQNPIPPTWAGGIFDRDAALWIRHNVDRFTLIGEEIVNEIPTKILEAHLTSSDEIKLFIKKGHPTLLGEKGRVRLYIAPTLGHALPRLDGFGSGPVIQRIDQTEFKEAVPGLYIPRMIDIAYVGWLNLKDPNLDVTGPTATHTWLELLEVELVNQPIPKSDFEIPLSTTATP